MSTHKHFCIMCGKDVYCCDDELALNCGDSYCDHALTKKQKRGCIAFCSAACFHTLEEKMKARWAVYQEICQEGL